MNKYDEFGNAINNDRDISDDENADEYEYYDDVFSQESDDKNTYDIDKSDDSVEYITEEEDEINIHELQKSKIEDTYVTTNIPETTFEYNYFDFISKIPDRYRSVVIIGDLLHGKSAIIDCIYEYIHPNYKRLKIEKPTDTEELNKYHINEYKNSFNRNITIKPVPLNVCVSADKSYNDIVFIDTPGHSNLIDEVQAAARLCDGALLVVSALLGPLENFKNAFEICIKEGISNYILCISQIDRIIIEQKLPPFDFYCKLQWIINKVNSIRNYFSIKYGIQINKFDPVTSNVIFISVPYNIFFTIEVFVDRYLKQFQINCNKHKTKVLPNTICKYFWGDYIVKTVSDKDEKEIGEEFHNMLAFCKTTDLSLKDTLNLSQKPTFVEFILEPLYKIIVYSLNYSEKELQPLLNKFNIKKGTINFNNSTDIILQSIFKCIFKLENTIFKSIIENLPTAKQNAQFKIMQLSNNNIDSTFMSVIKSCDSSEKTIFISSLNYIIENKKGTVFGCLSKVLSGTIHVDDNITIFEDNQDIAEQIGMYNYKVKKLYILQPTYKVEVPMASAGNIILIEGIEKSYLPSMIGVNTEQINGLTIQQLKKCELSVPKVLKVACQPYNPVELTELQNGFNVLVNDMKFVSTQIQLNGLHIINVRGELAADIVLQFLREKYTHIEIINAQPIAQLRETVTMETNNVNPYKVPNSDESFVTCVEPLEYETVKYFETSDCKRDFNRLDICNILQHELNYDSISSQGFIQFAPNGITSLLFNEIIPTINDEIDNKNSDTEIINNQLSDVFENCISLAFEWASKEGPLLEEPVIYTKFKLLDASKNISNAIPSVLISSIYKGFHDNILNSKPRIVEPFFLYDIVVESIFKQAIIKLIEKSRGNMIRVIALPATIYLRLFCVVPVIDSLGFEVDVRARALGRAIVQNYFWHWNILVNDPLNQDVSISSTEINDMESLPRELYVKYRRQKGLKI